MDQRSDENEHTISAAADLAAITEDTKTTVFFVDKEGDLSSLISGPKDSIEATANASTPWTAQKILISGKPIKASTTVKSIGAVVWGNDEKKEVRVYFAKKDNTLTELCQSLVKKDGSWVDDDPTTPWYSGFLGRKLDNTSQGYPPPVHPMVAPTSSIAAAAIGKSQPPQVEIFFSEVSNADKLACIYSYADPAYTKSWAWRTKYVGDKPADSKITIPREKPDPKPIPEPGPGPGPGPTPPDPGPTPPSPILPPLPPIGRGRDRNRYPFLILGTGFGFIFGFIMGIVCYEPFGNSRRPSNLWR